MWNFLYPKEYNAFKHAVLTFAIGFVLMLLSYLAKAIGIELEETFLWMIVAACTLLFAASCSIYVAFNIDFNKFLLKAVIAYVFLMVSLGLVAYLFCRIPLQEAGFYKWILIVVTFCFLVFLSLVNAVKAIVEYAQKEEWNQPKIRKRK